MVWLYALGQSVPTLCYHSFLGYDQSAEVPSSSSRHHDEVQQVAEGRLVTDVE